MIWIKKKVLQLNSEWLTHVPEATEIDFVSQAQEVSGLENSLATEK